LLSGYKKGGQKRTCCTLLAHHRWRLTPCWRLNERASQDDWCDALVPLYSERRFLASCPNDARCCARPFVKDLSTNRTCARIVQFGANHLRPPRPSETSEVWTNNERLDLRGLLRPRRSVPLNTFTPRRIP
jgi:hypothetical protein